MKFPYKKMIYPVTLSIILWATLFFARKGKDHYALESVWLTGIFLLLQGMMFFVSREGVFHSIRWGFGRIVDIFRVKPKYSMQYHEYVEMRNSKTRVAVWPSFLVGAIFFLIGLIWWLIIR